jgi:hypothetical protein
MNPIPIHLAVEDSLSEIMLRVLLKQSGRNYAVGAVYGGSGFGYLKKMTPGFNRAARGTPFLLLTDLDRTECPPRLIEEWLGVAAHPNFLFRVAVREVESWVIAHKKGLARFFGLPVATIPDNPDQLETSERGTNKTGRPIKTSNYSRRHCSSPGSHRSQGAGYNSRLGEFIKYPMACSEAANASPSLDRTIRRIRSFKPVEYVNTNRKGIA